MARVVLLPQAQPERWFAAAERHRQSAATEHAIFGRTPRHYAYKAAARAAQDKALQLSHLARLVDGANVAAEETAARQMLAPVLAAKISPDGRVVFFDCPHCRRRHTHGADGILDGRNPHRLAHCADAASPFAATGYVLEVRR